MSGTFVAAYLLRVTDALTLRRPPVPVRRGGGPPAEHDPAVLVIPRGGIVRDPYLVVLARACGVYEALPTGLAAVDIHVRARIDASRDHTWQEMADVLVHPGRWPRRTPTKRMALLLGRFPGCEILVGCHRWGYLLGMRDGRMVAVTRSSSLRTSVATAWPAVYGSVLHTWLSAGMPLSTMESAVVIAGHCVVGVGEISQFAVSARSLVRVIPPQHRRHRFKQPQHLFLADPSRTDT